MLKHRYLVPLAGLLLLGALPCLAVASPASRLATEMERLVRSPEAKSLEHKALNDVVAAKWRPSLKQFLSANGNRLTPLQKGILGLGARISSPRHRSLRSALIHHRMNADRIPELVGFLAMARRSSAIRQLIRDGNWLQNHPDQLSTYLAGYEMLTEADGVEPLARKLGALMSQPGASGYFQRLASTTVASLLSSQQLSGIPKGPQSSARGASRPFSAVVPLSLGAKGFCQKAMDEAQVLLAEQWQHATTSLNETMSAAQKWAQDHQPQIRRYLEQTVRNGEVVLTWLSDGWIGAAKTIVVESWLVSYLQDKVVETAAIIGKQLPKTPTRQAPGDPDFDGHRHRRFQRSGAHASLSSCAGDESQEGAVGPPQNGEQEGDGGLDLVIEGSLASTVPGAWYSQELSAQGGAGGLSWTASGLPAGLNINFNTGEISGWTQQLGESKVHVTVKDSAGGSGTATLVLSSEQPSCAGNPCAVAYGHSEVTVAWTCGCVNPFPTEYHGVFGYFVEPYVNGVAGGHVGSPFLLGPLHVNAPDGSEGVPVFQGPGGLLWYSYPHHDLDPHFSQAPPDVMAIKVYFIAERNSDGAEVAFPIGTSNTVTVR